MTSVSDAQTRGRSVATRVASHWALKFFGTAVFITVFFFGYFILQRSPIFPLTIIPVTALDRMIPFQPAMLWVYLSLWFYVSLPPTLLATRPQLYAYGWMAGAVSVVGLGIFFFWPTSIMPTTDIDWTAHPGFGWLKGVDAAQNACPSLHVTFAVFTGVWLDRLLRPLARTSAARWLNLVWCVGIVYSTMATRQHVAIDAYAGTALGLAGAWYRPGPLKEI